jgi:hypothetical protein
MMWWLDVVVNLVIGAGEKVQGGKGRYRNEELSN